MANSKLSDLAQTKKKTKAPKFQNFIEAFKDTQGGSQPSDRVNNDFDFEAFLTQRENRIRQQERSRMESIRHEEQVIFSREKQQVKAQIETLQVEIKALAKDQVGLMVEAEKAAFEAVVNPGVYHQNFFERLLALIKLARKKISESRTWLQLQNHRNQKRQGYWAGVKKSGTSFMLSGERTVATQSG